VTTRLRPFPEPVERVASFLRVAAVDATIQEFPEGTPTAEEAARAAGCKLEQIVKSLVFVADGEYVLALVPGDRRADERKVAAEVEAREVRVARGREVLDATGFEPGAVAPFPRRDVVAVLLERTLLQHQIVWIGAGSPAHMAMLAPSDLQRLAGARTADLVARS
jgi:prolyl-tRNA editing enzyme YbaK/EbsC (Cys-tRNA(Pro) deacylase)